MLHNQTREMARNMMLRFGQDSFRRTYIRLRDFYVGDEDLKRIGCPGVSVSPATRVDGLA
ncbi:MAG: hypothetical protein IRY87_28465 [Acetobacteraceae bacterium]|nr:hypothetical protein [Acetobacteraceae bacterium]